MVRLKFALYSVVTLFNHPADGKRLVKNFLGPVVVQRINDQGSEVKTLALNTDPFGIVDMELGIHPVWKLGGFSLLLEIFYDFFMPILVDDQVQLEAVEVEQFFDVFGFAVGRGVDADLPAVMSQLFEKFNGPLAQGFDRGPFVISGQFHRFRRNFRLPADECVVKIECYQHQCPSFSIFFKPFILSTTTI